MRKKIIIGLLLSSMTFGITANLNSTVNAATNIAKTNTIAQSKGAFYYGTIEGTGVRFRKSPGIKSSNIIRTFKKGERIYVYQTNINCKYADGYWWS